MTACATQITVALVEDDAATRARLERVVSADPGLRLLHAAADARGILAWLSANPVDVLLADLGLPDGSGLDVIRRCRTLQPACEVMVITMFGDESNMLSAFESGARGYLLKDGTEADLAAHVLNLHAGGSPMSPIIARQLLVRWQARMAPSAVALTPSVEDNTLSRRERDVLDLVSRGFTYAETARQLGVALTTVHTHVRNIYGKLDVHNKAEAIYEARQTGVLPR